MVEPDDFSFDTLALHAGQVPDGDHRSRAVPIHQTTSYVFEDTDHAASLFDLQLPGHLYSRISNPTVAVFEERMAALEAGVAAVATASGMAALHLAVATLTGAGGHVVASRTIYGGSVNLLTHTLPRFGITTTWVDHDDLDGWASAIRPTTTLLLTETIGNPRCQVTDLGAVAAIGRERGVPLVVDSTFATPWLCRPADHGAAVVHHSATKFIGGHGVAVGGVLVDTGTFPWEDHAERFPTLTEPHPGYHGLDFVEEFGVAAFAAHARADGLRDFGASLPAQSAFHLLQGLETLPVRMARHVATANEVAGFLADHPAVRWLAYPGHPSHPDHGLAARLLPRGAGAVLSFGIAGGRDAGRRCIEALRLWSHLANVGDAKSLVIHPASTTHQQMSPEELAAAGVGEDLVRLSVGLEDPGDLMADLDRALRASQR